MRRRTKIVYFGKQGTTVYCLGAGWGSPHMARIRASVRDAGVTNADA